MRRVDTDVLPLPLQNHFFVDVHITTAAGSCIPQYLWNEAQVWNGMEYESIGME